MIKKILIFGTLFLSLLILVNRPNLLSTVEVELAKNDNDWEVKSPEKLEMDKKILDNLDQHIRKSPHLKIHSFILIRDGYIVYEKYYRNIDECSSYEINVNNKHFIGTTSFTVISSLIGKMCEEKNISEDQFISKYFSMANKSDYDKIKIKHLISMSTGIKWDLDHLYRVLTMDNPLDEIFNQNLIFKPGSKHSYNSSSFVLAIDLIQRVYKKDFILVLDEKIFKPLNIKDYFWGKKDSGYYFPGYGVLMRIRDLAKISQLYLDDGKWKGQQILSKQWVEKVLTDYYPDNDYYGYGYGWRVNKIYVNNELLTFYSSHGYGGQIMVIIPKYKINFVMTAGNYGDWTRGTVARDFIEFSIIPAIKKKF